MIKVNLAIKKELKNITYHNLNLVATSATHSQHYKKSNKIRVFHIKKLSYNKKIICDNFLSHYNHNKYYSQSSVY